MLTKPIILIGPIAAGKSTVANLLAKNIGIPNIPMDRVRWYFYFKDGFSQEVESEFATFTEKMAYWKPFEVKAVQRIISEFPNSIIDFGAGHSCYEDPTQLSAVELVLKPLPNIFLLMPSENKKTSLEICNRRLTEADGAPPDDAVIEANKLFINHESNYRLAKHIIYTESKTVLETAEEIQSLLF
jgi:shikimate kinase